MALVSRIKRKETFGNPGFVTGAGVPPSPAENVQAPSLHRQSRGIGPRPAQMLRAHPGAGPGGSIGRPATIEVTVNGQGPHSAASVQHNTSFPGGPNTPTARGGAGAGNPDPFSGGVGGSGTVIGGGGITPSGAPAPGDATRSSVPGIR